MKIGGRIIQTRNIVENTDSSFEARYKNHTIYITTNHRHGEAKYEHLNRYDIDVIHDDGSYAVQTWEDLHSMRDAILFALNGALL